MRSIRARQARTSELISWKTFHVPFYIFFFFQSILRNIFQRSGIAFLNSDLVSISVEYCFLYCWPFPIGNFPWALITGGE